MIDSGVAQDRKLMEAFCCTPADFVQVPKKSLISGIAVFVRRIMWQS